MRRIKHPVVELCNIIAQHILLDQSQHDEEESCPKHSAGSLFVSFQSGYQIGGTGDRTRHQQRKEGEIEAILQERYLHVKLALIGIYRIADSLEGIERDTYRQSDRLQGEIGAEHLVDYIANDEIGIFEIAQQSQVYKHYEGEQRLACLSLMQSHFLGYGIIDASRKRQHPHHHSVHLIGKEKAEADDIHHHGCARIALEQDINGKEEDEEQRKRNAAHHQRRICLINKQPLYPMPQGTYFEC